MTLFLALNGMPPSPCVVPTPDYSGWLVCHIPERPYQSSYSQDASFPSLFVPTSFKNNTHTLAKSSPKRFELFLELAQKKFQKRTNACQHGGLF